MAMALSRPAADDFALAMDHPAVEQLDADGAHSIASDATQAEIDVAKVQGGPAANGAAPQGATASASQNAATLGADEVLAKQSSQSPASTGAKSLDSAAQSTQARPTRFTTLEEEEAIRRAQQQRSWLLLAGQLAVTVAVLGAIGWIAWYLSRPPSADALYSTVMSRIEADETGSLVRVENEVNDFIKRFPDDPRVNQFKEFKDRIELNKLERTLERRARGNASAMPALLPAEQLYLRATSAADSDPDHALKLLESLVNLYGPAEPARDPNVPRHATRKDSNTDAGARAADVVLLAERRMKTLRADLEHLREKDLAMLNERLAVAEKLEKTEADRAAGIYKAIIDLHHDDPWAEAIVTKARTRLAELKK
jgi:serine/threonine-protein kinase